MRPKCLRAIVLSAIGTAACQPEVGDTQVERTGWLDESTPSSWSASGRTIPAAPGSEGNGDPRCRELARPAELDVDRQVEEQGWNLDGAYQGGWQTVVIRGTAGYDGMCRPLQYQAFVFVDGAFAGTLSPSTMNSRTDGALTRVFLQDQGRLVAQYARYTAEDALCCPSATTTVVFQADDEAVLRPVSASTSSAL